MHFSNLFQTCIVNFNLFRFFLLLLLFCSSAIDPFFSTSLTFCIWEEQNFKKEKISWSIFNDRSSKQNKKHSKEKTFVGLYYRYYFHPRVCVCVWVCTPIISKSSGPILMKLSRMMYNNNISVSFEDEMNQFGRMHTSLIWNYKVAVSYTILTWFWRILLGWCIMICDRFFFLKMSLIGPLERKLETIWVFGYCNMSPHKISAFSQQKPKFD